MSAVTLPTATAVSAEPATATVKVRRPLPAWVPTSFGVGLILAVWILCASTLGIRKGFPQPWDVLTQLWDDRSLYPDNITTTLGEAAKGYVIGNVLAILLALAFVLVPLLEKALMQIAVVSACLPLVALGPILQSTLDGDSPKVALVAIFVFFTTLVGVLVGLRSADRTSLEVVRAYGGNRFTEMRKIRIRAALPSTFAALQIAAPSAILGAILGEYFGGERGLGIFMIASLQGFKVARTWGIAAVASALSGVAFFVTAMIGRSLTRWAPRAE